MSNTVVLYHCIVSILLLHTCNTEEACLQDFPKIMKQTWVMYIYLFMKNKKRWWWTFVTFPGGFGGASTFGSAPAFGSSATFGSPAGLTSPVQQQQQSVFGQNVPSSGGFARYGCIVEISNFLESVFF